MATDSSISPQLVPHIATFDNAQVSVILVRDVADLSHSDRHPQNKIYSISRSLNLSCNRFHRTSKGSE